MIVYIKFDVMYISPEKKEGKIYKIKQKNVRKELK